MSVARDDRVTSTPPRPSAG